MRLSLSATKAHECPLQEIDTVCEDQLMGLLHADTLRMRFNNNEAEDSCLCRCAPAATRESPAELALGSREQVEGRRGARGKKNQHTPLLGRRWSVISSFTSSTPVKRDQGRQGSL